MNSKSQPSVIHPNRFYSTEELRQILHGRIKIETLKAHGLAGLAKDYWGQNIIYAINRYWHTILAERGLCRPREEARHGAIFEKRGLVSNGPVSVLR
ncbi:MAG: hypothetical protein KC994_27365, partial [Candidatus Omnitrophica bacterium]|nr:hypothetical protein [Candidatus Omnitrophota bacterium]